MGEDGETPDRGMPLLSVPAAPWVDAMWVFFSPPAGGANDGGEEGEEESKHYVSVESFHFAVG